MERAEPTVVVTDLVFGEEDFGERATRTDPWISGYGSTSETQSLDDVDGDNAADVVTFYKPSGAWFVAPSAIDSFGRPVQWQGGHGAASDVQRVADVTGDDKGAVAFTAGDGTWSVAPATPVASGTHAP